MGINQDQMYLIVSILDVEFFDPIEPFNEELTRFTALRQVERDRLRYGDAEDDDEDTSYRYDLSRITRARNPIEVRLERFRREHQYATNRQNRFIEQWSKVKADVYRQCAKRWVDSITPDDKRFGAQQQLIDDNFLLAQKLSIVNTELNTITEALGEAEERIKEYKKFFGQMIKPGSRKKF